MAVIYVPGAFSGTQYAVNIAGDVPTPAEQARIDQYVAQQESAFQSQYESMFGSTGETEAAPPEDTTAFGRSVDIGLAGLGRAYGSTLEGIGTVTGLESLAGYGAGVAERQGLELDRLAEAAALEREREAQGAIGSAATYIGEIAGASAPQTAVSLAGGYAGAKVGAAIGAFGGPVGAVVGGTVGALGGAALASLPYFYGDFREQQKEADIEAGRPVEVSEGAAALAAAPASLLDGVLSAVGAKYGANVLKKAAEGGLFTRAARGAAGGVVTEVPTELGQELLGILQAGKDPLSDEAIQRYGEAALGAAVLGGGIGAAGGAFVTGRKEEAERKKRELDEDMEELGARGDQYIQNARESRAAEAAEKVASPEAAPLALPAPSTARTTPQEETALRGRAGMEAITPTRPVALTSLPMEERVAISQARANAGREPSPEVTLEELQAIVGTAASEREAKKQKPVTGGIARFGPVENKTFTQDQYDRAVQQVKADKGVSFPKIQKAVRDITKAKVPNTVVRDIRDEMVSRGVIRADTKSRTGYSLEPIARTDSIETGLRQEIDGLNKQIDLSQKERKNLIEEVRRVEQTGKDSTGKRADPALFNQKLDTLDASIEAAKARVAAAETEIKSAKQAGAIPSVERVALDAAKVAVPVTEATAPAIQQQMETLRQNIAGYNQQISDAEKQAANLRKRQKKVQLNNAQKARLQQLEQTAADLKKLRDTATARLRDPSATVQAAKEREAAGQARFNAATMKEPVNYTPIFTAQQQKVFAALRKRLNNLGLKDVRLEGAQAMLARDQSGRVMGVAEGKYDPVKRIISLSMGIYRKGMTDQELFDSIASVMNHEVIHALRLMGVLTDAEWSTLTTYAKNKKYVAIKQGKPVERSYTYEERARAMGYDEAVIQEEAVAELFRDYLDGKTTVKGPQKTIFERLKNFFKALIGVHTERGFDSVEKIFEGIRYGEIGARPRGAAPVAQAAAPAAVPTAEADVSVDDQLSPEELADLNRQLDDLAVAIAADPRERKSFMPVPSPVKNRDGTDSYSYGNIIDYRGRKQSVILPVGEHIFRERGVDTGYGLKHIIARKHDQELYEMSKYKDVNKAIFDMLQVWKQQGMKSGDSVIGGKDGDQFALEWIDNRPLKAPRLRLVLSENNRLTPDPFHYVHSFYPSETRVYERGPKPYRRFSAIPAKIMEEYDADAFSSVPISSRLRSLSVLDRVGEDGNFRDVAPRNKKGERVANIKKEDAMRTLQEDRGNFVFDLRDPESVDQIATIMAAEAEAALDGDTSALGWYDRLVKLAKRVVATLHPEILTDKDAEHAFDYATAVTSNGLSVKDNYILANKQYENWRSTGYFIEGKEGTSGKQGASMEAAFGAYNMMKRPRDEGGLGMSDAQIMDFLSSRMTVGDLRKNRVVQSLGITVDAKEKSTAVINGSYIMGPKIGQGFYQNLRGNFDQLTMDRWWMRFFNRLSGNPFKTYGDETIQSNINRLRSAMVDPSDVPMILQAMKDIDADILTDEVVGQLSVEIDKVFQRAYMKAPKGQKPKKNEIFLAADSLRPKIEGELEESPRNATDREFMRDVTRRAVDKLDAATGVRLDMADFQALMWYWEKRLWRSLGIRQGRGEDNDYVDGAIELLRKQGVPDEQIREALPDGERQRLSAEPDTGRDEAEVPSGVGGRLEEEGRIAAERAAYAAGVEERSNKITGARESRVPLRNSITGKVQRQTAQKQTNVVYSKAADLLAKGLRITGIGADEARSKQIADGIIKKFQDGMIPVGRMIDELRANGLNITDAMDTYMQEELYHGVVGEKVEQAQTNLYRPLIDLVGTLKVTDQAKQQLIAASNSASVGRGFADVAFNDTRSNALSMADIFLYARHAKERNEYIRGIDPENDAGSGMTDGEADAILAWFASSPYASTMQKIADATQRIVQSTNDVRLEGGLIPREFFQYTDPTTGDTVDVPQYDNYVPLRGKRDPSGEPVDEQATGPYRSPMYGARRREDRRSLGRYDYADNIIPNLLVQNQNAIIRAERNKVGQSFLQLLRSDPAKTKGYGRILKPGDMRDVQKRVLVERKRADGTVVQTVQTMLDPNFRNEPDIFVVKEDGKEVIVKLESDAIASALKGSMSPTHNNGLIRALATINRYLASINTSLNPAFFITNMFRDLQTAGVNVAQYEIDGLTRKIVRDVPGALRGIKQSIRNNDNSSEWARIYRDFVKNGGQNATNQVNTVADQMNNISGIIGDIADSGARKQFNRVKNGFVGKGAMSLLSFIEDYNTVIENGIRVTTYKALLDKGFTPQRAAQAARNITVNFAKGGDYKTFMNAMYLFYNASLQGSFAMLNAALRSKRVQKFWAAAIGVGIMQDYLNAMMSGDDEDGEKLYDKIPEYVLEHNLILPDVFGFTDRSYISIPMPYGLNMAHNLGRAMGRLSRGAYEPSEAAGSIVGTMLDTVNPIGGSESFANAASPTVLDPFIDIWQNENFANQPVYKEGFPGDRTPSSQLYWSTTSVPAVWLANAMNSVTGGTTEVKGMVDVSPDLIDFWFEYLTGGVGRFVIRTAETPFKAYDEGFSEDVIRNVPILGKIIGTITTREDTGAYVEKRNRVLTALDEVKAAVEEGNTERLADARERFSDELKVSGAVRAIDNALRKLSRQMRQVREGRLPEDQKRLILERLDERRQQLTARANQLMRDI